VPVVDLLPDELLLDIFDHIRRSRTDFQLCDNPVWKWHVLVHVCRRWRQIVFASPLRLDLQLLCTYGTPATKYLACWPAFPIVVSYNSELKLTPNVEDDVIAALEYHSRISQIKLAISSSLWSRMATVMRKPFPALTSLSVYTMDKNVPSIPSGFLGGSAPCLREIQFHGIPTPALPTLLFYTSDLVELVLRDIDTPRTDFISPAALVARLAMLHRLKDLLISLPLWTPQLDPELELDHWQTHLPPKPRVVLPALTSFAYYGERTYLEDFVAQIDVPRLDQIHITFHDLAHSQIPQLSEFINRSGLKSSRFEFAKICFDNRNMVFVDLNQVLDRPSYSIPYSIHILSCDGVDDKVWCMTPVLRQTSAMLSNVSRLEINTERPSPPEEEDEDMDDIDWLEFLRPFTAVETLHVCEKLAKSIAHALEGLRAEADSQVLPALNLLFLEGEPTRSMNRRKTGPRSIVRCYPM
jgi:hypothetical protein